MTWKQRQKRTAYRVARTLVLSYVVVAILFYALQTRLIFPGASTQGSADAVVDPPPRTELLTLRAAEGTRIVALFGKGLDSPPEKSAAAPTILYFYGNAMCLKDALGEFQQFRKLGANVLAVEYAGFGMSGGEAGEQGCYAAAEAGYQHLLQRTDINPHKIVAAGWSLGGAVAIDLARRHADEGHICGVMTFSAFTSVADIGRYHYPGVPVSLLLKHRFLSEEKVGHIGVPLLIGHGRHDEIAPYFMSDRLAAAAERGGVKVTRLTLEDAGHNDFFSVGESAIDQAVAKFLKAL